MYSGGSGTALDPYLVGTPEDLYNVRENPSAYFQQINDIDMSGFGQFEAPAANFTGFFDGRNFAIKNITIVNGLFGTVSGATIQNVKVENVGLVSTDVNVGVIARIVESNAIIQFCRVIGGVVNSSHNRTGGIAGYMQRATIRFCYTDIKVIGRQDTGGILGYYYSSAGRGYLLNCYALGDVYGTEYVGGILGRLGRQLDLKNCYAVGYIQGTNRVGGIVGHIEGYSGQQPNVESCFALNKGIIREAGSSGQFFGRIFGSIVSPANVNIKNNYALENIKFYPDGLEEE